MKHHLLRGSSIITVAVFATSLINARTIDSFKVYEKSGLAIESQSIIKVVTLEEVKKDAGFTKQLEGKTTIDALDQNLLEALNSDLKKKFGERVKEKIKAEKAEGKDKVESDLAKLDSDLETKQKALEELEEKKQKELSSAKDDAEKKAIEKKYAPQEVEKKAELKKAHESKIAALMKEQETKEAALKAFDVGSESLKGADSLRLKVLKAMQALYEFNKKVTSGSDEKRLSDLEKKVDEIKREKAKLESDAELSKDMINDLKNDEKELQQGIKERNDEIKSHLTTLKCKRDLVSEYQKDPNTSCQKPKIINNEKYEIGLIENQLKKSRASLKGEKQELTAKKTALEKEVKDLESIKSKIDTQDSELKKTKSEHDDIKSKYSGLLNSLKEAVEKLNSHSHSDKDEDSNDMSSCVNAADNIVSFLDLDDDQVQAIEDVDIKTIKGQINKLMTSLPKTAEKNAMEADVQRIKEEIAKHQGQVKEL